MIGIKLHGIQTDASIDRRYDALNILGGVRVEVVNYAICQDKRSKNKTSTKKDKMGENSRSNIGAENGGGKCVQIHLIVKLGKRGNDKWFEAFSKSKLQVFVRRTQVSTHNGLYCLGNSSEDICLSHMVALPPPVPQFDVSYNISSQNGLNKFNANEKVENSKNSNGKFGVFNKFSNLPPPSDAEGFRALYEFVQKTLDHTTCVTRTRSHCSLCFRSVEKMVELVILVTIAIAQLQILLRLLAIAITM
jgi:hypothetical protein